MIRTARRYLAPVLARLGRHEAQRMCALHPFGEDGYRVLDEWAKRTTAKNYDAAKQRREWDKLRDDKPNGTTARSIYKLALGGGWKPAHPRPEDEFGDIFDGAGAEQTSGGAGAEQRSGPETEKPKARLETRRGDQIKMKRVEWLWPDRFPRGMCSLLAGNPDKGKSTVLLDIAARVSRGAPWPDDDLLMAPKGSVVVFATEDTAEEVILPRFVACGGDPTKLHVVSGVRCEDGKGRRTFNLQADLALLEQKLDEIGEVQLVIFDPLSAYFGKADTWRNTEVRAVLEPIGEMAARRQVTVIGNTHLAKSAKGSANMRVLDSVAIAAHARAIYMAVDDAGNPARRLFVPSKGNLARRGVTGLSYEIEAKTVDKEEGIDGTFVKWGEAVDMNADQAFATLEKSEKQKPDTEALTAACDFWQTYLANGPQPSAETYDAGEANGHSEMTLRRAFRKLHLVAKPGELSGAWLISLPPLDGTAAP